MARKLTEAKKLFEEQKVQLKRDMEKICVDKLSEAEKRADARRVESLAEQDKKFQAQMATVLKELEIKHTEDIRLLRAEIHKREEYIAKLHQAVDFVRESRRDLINTTLDVHEQMKYFIDKTQPFNAGNAQFLVPRLDLSRFTAEPDIDPPY